MVWTLETSNGRESDKIAHLVVPYMSGLGVDLGCGPNKVWPTVIGVDSCKDYNGQKIHGIDIVSECDKLSIFSDNSLDFVYSSHLLEHFYEKDVVDILDEWGRTLKTGGHLILYVPSSNFYPKVGEEGSNPDHKWNVAPDSVEAKLQEGKWGWTQVEKEERSENNEYSLFLVFQKRDDTKFVEQIWQRNPDDKKRCLVIRYGAIGDQIVASSILPELRKQGYFVTYNTTPDGMNIIKHDPYIDEFFLQPKDFVPNQQLGAYWESLRLSKRYDKIINLCESMEGALLTLAGRLTNDYSHGARQRLYNKNYLEHTHDIADVPYEFHSRFYPTDNERFNAAKKRKKFDDKVIVWALTGSSVHKVYPWTQIVLAWLIEKTPFHIVLTGDAKDGKMLQDAIIEELKKDGRDVSRIHGWAGKQEIRECLTFAQYADCVIGPETGVLNSVSMENVPKVMYLSHSSQENLTKHWKNITVLEPEASKCPCYPCHRLITGWDHCTKDEDTNAALCASSISAQRVYDGIMLAMGFKKAMAA